MGTTTTMTTGASSGSPVPPASQQLESSPAALPKRSPSQPTSRRPSFSFLTRSKSLERLQGRRTSSGGNKLSKKQSKEQGLLAQKQAAAIPEVPPVIPDLPAQPGLQTFGGEDAKPVRQGSVYAKMGRFYAGNSAPGTAHGDPATEFVPAMPRPNRAASVDRYTDGESMAHRGRFSYAGGQVGTVNDSPRRLRRRKDPTPFNVLVVGARNCGKTSLIDFLQTSLALPARRRRTGPREDEGTVDGCYSRRNPSNFPPRYLETELEDGERIGLTLWDSDGLERSIVDLQLREISSFLEAKFEETFSEEMKVVRSPNARDTHIHAVLLVLDPLRLDGNLAAAKEARNAAAGRPTGGRYAARCPPPLHGPGVLDRDLDLQVLQALHGKTTVIPVIAKADTVTTDHMGLLKRAVADELAQAHLDPLEALDLEDAEPAGEGAGRAAAEAQGRYSDGGGFDERDEADPPMDDPYRTPDRPTFEPDSDLSLGTNDAVQLRTEDRHRAPPPVPSAGNTAGRNPYLPLSVISPDPIVPHEPNVPGKVGRRFPWGFADPYDEGHCDFVRLKEAVFGEWRGSLREVSRERWYEAWRTERLGGRDSGRRTPAEEVGLAR